MIKKTVENINISGNDPIEELVDEIDFVMKVSGRTFVAKLIGYNDRELWFRTRSGNVIMNRRDDIKTMSIYTPKPGGI